MPQHTIDPFICSDSSVLILGSFPSVKSRQTGFYYGHPQNRFWKVVSSLYNESVPHTIEEKKALLKRCRIALWDVIASCDIRGSSDASIRNIAVNPVGSVLRGASIERIYTNGATAKRLYDTYLKQQTGLEAIPLPSTSPANASYSIEHLINAWSVIL